jgi:hypothetical protein
MAAEDKWLEYSQCVITEMTHLDELKNTYNKTKDAITKKHNSITTAKKIIMKNAKISYKLGNINASTDTKIETFQQMINNSIKNRDNDINVIKEKYENKMKLEIAEINNKHDKNMIYYTSQMDCIKKKSETVTHDLSNNIIEESLYEEIDEDAHPILTKLKFDIEIQEKKIVDYTLIRDRAAIDAEKIRTENRRSVIESNRQEEREMLRKDDERRQKAMEERQRQIDHDNQQTEIRYAERRKRDEEALKNKN